MSEGVIVGGHRIKGQWRPIQARTDGAAPVRNPQTGKMYWAGAAAGFGATIYRNWDVIRPVGAGLSEASPAGWPADLRAQRQVQWRQVPRQFESSGKENGNGSNNQERRDIRSVRRALRRSQGKSGRRRRKSN